MNIYHSKIDYYDFVIRISSENQFGRVRLREFYTPKIRWI